MQRILLAVICLVFWHRNNAEGNGPALKQTEYTKICKLAESLRKIPGGAKFKLEQQHQAATEMTKAILKLRVAAAATTNSNASAVYGAMADAINRQLLNQQKNTQAATPLALDAAAAASAAAGRIAELAELLSKAAAGGSNTAHCLAAAGTGNNVADSSSYSDSCHMAEYQPSTADYDFSDGEITAQGFKDLDNSNAGDSSASNRCAITKKANAGAQATDLFQSNGPHTLAADTIVLNVDDTGASTSLKLANAQTNLAQDWQLIGTANTKLKKLYEQLTKLRQVKLPIQAGDADTLIKQTADTSLIKEYLTTAVRATNSKLSSDQAQSQAEALANSVFGTANDKSSKVFNTIQKINTVKVEAEQIKPLQLEALTDEVDLLNALSYHTATNRNKISAKAPACPDQDKPETVSADNKVKDCSGKKGDDCKGECEWDGEGDNKKCVKDQITSHHR